MIQIISCITSNRAIGINNNMVVHSKEYLEWLRKEVEGTYIIVGKKTYEEGVLPEDIYENEYYVLEDGVGVVDVFNDKDISILGGEKTYESFIDQVDVIKLAEMNGYYTADAFFPDFNVEYYDVELVEDLDEKNGLGVIKEYWRRN